jgi:YegS/Rv2252/BmrU family lipid kinase
MQADKTDKQSDSSSLTRFFAIIIANPASGSGGLPHHTRHLHETLTFLRAHGWRADLWYTHAAGEGEQLARKAVELKANLVIAAGGDGTINEIIQGLAGSETALGVLPNGTVNVWARELGIPLDEAGARDLLVHGRTRSVDLGCVNGRYFLLMVGIGFDGEVIQAVERKPLKRLGVIGYALAALWLGPGYSGFPVVVQIDGLVVKTRALQIFVGNTQLYAGAFKFTWRAKIDDGLLDLCIVRKRNLPGRIMVLWDFLLRREQRRLWVRYDTFTSIKIETLRPVAYHIDGEVAGYTPATFQVAPAALKVIVPQKTPEGLFSGE